MVWEWGEQPPPPGSASLWVRRCGTGAATPSEPWQEGMGQERHNQSFLPASAAWHRNLASRRLRPHPKCLPTFQLAISVPSELLLCARKEEMWSPVPIHICVLSLHILQLEKGKNTAQLNKQQVEQEWVENLRTQENGVAKGCHIQPGSRTAVLLQSSRSRSTIPYTEVQRGSLQAYLHPRHKTQTQ